jgi:hypothetical protein
MASIWINVDYANGRENVFAGKFWDKIEARIASRDNTMRMSTWYSARSRY